MSRARRIIQNATRAARAGAELGELVEEAREVWERFHWGDESLDLIEADGAPEVLDGDVLVVLGELARVDYETTKGGDSAIWFHEFEAERPQLCLTRDGRLVIVGGDYRVTRRGIVG
jgi:hypothetical protein